jgi:CRISPR-associated Cas5-like protein
MSAENTAKHHIFVYLLLVLEFLLASFRIPLAFQQHQVPQLVFPLISAWEMNKGSNRGLSFLQLKRIIKLTQEEVTA